MVLCLSAAKKSGKVQEISVNDRVSVFLELAEAHRMLDEQVRHFVVSLHDSLVRCWTLFGGPDSVCAMRTVQDVSFPQVRQLQKICHSDFSETFLIL